MKNKTQNLIKKLKLVPKFNESIYSQSFIERERQMIRDLTDNTEKKI